MHTHSMAWENTAPPHSLCPPSLTNLAWRRRRKVLDSTECGREDVKSKPGCQAWKNSLKMNIPQTNPEPFSAGWSQSAQGRQSWMLRVREQQCSGVHSVLWLIP